MGKNYLILRALRFMLEQAEARVVPQRKPEEDLYAPPRGESAAVATLRVLRAFVDTSGSTGATTSDPATSHTKDPQTSQTAGPAQSGRCVVRKTLVGEYEEQILVGLPSRFAARATPRSWKCASPVATFPS